MRVTDNTTIEDATPRTGKGAFFVPTVLGEKRHLTPEGFLLCEDVPLARTGVMLYGAGELPGDIPVGRDGVIRVIRDEEEVFRPEFVLSFAGKPFVNDHPPVDVDPSNWKRYAGGTILNPRRGTGADTDLLFADIMVTDQALIDEINKHGKREVSCGYEAEYEVDDDNPGYARQYSMRGNHVALVDSGRCGPRCAIGDRKTVTTGDSPMKTRDKKLSFMDKIRAAFKAKDEEGMEKALDEAEEEIGKKDKVDDEDPGEHTHIHLTGPAIPATTDAAMEGRLGALEAGHQEIKDSLEGIKEHLGIGEKKANDAEPDEKKEEKEAMDAMSEEVPENVQDSARKARDSAYLADSFQETLAEAEILVPGIKLPTFDTALSPIKTYDSICALRRQALVTAYATEDGKAEVETIWGKRKLALDSMACGAVRSLFKSVVAVRKVKSAARTADVGAGAVPGFGGGLGIQGPIKTIADLNKLYAEKYAKK